MGFNGNQKVGDNLDAWDRLLSSGDAKIDQKDKEYSEKFVEQLAHHGFSKTAGAVKVISDGDVYNRFEQKAVYEIFKEEKAAKADKETGFTYEGIDRKKGFTWVSEKTGHSALREDAKHFLEYLKYGQDELSYWAKSYGTDLSNKFREEAENHDESSTPYKVYIQNAENIERWVREGVGSTELPKLEVYYDDAGKVPHETIAAKDTRSSMEKHGD